MTPPARGAWIAPTFSRVLRHFLHPLHLLVLNSITCGASRSSTKEAAEDSKSKPFTAQRRCWTEDVVKASDCDGGVTMETTSSPSGGKSAAACECGRPDRKRHPSLLVIRDNTTAACLPSHKRQYPHNMLDYSSEAALFFT